MNDTQEQEKEEVQSVDTTTQAEPTLSMVERIEAAAKSQREAADRIEAATKKFDELTARNMIAGRSYVSQEKVVETQEDRDKALAKRLLEGI